MTSYKEGRFTNQRSQELYYRTWTPPSGPTKAALVFHHGYGSHCGAYDGEFKKMAEAGIALFMYDAHSFGRSQPLDPRYRSLVIKWEHLVDDLYAFRREIVDPRLSTMSSPPVILAGLSMGGMTSILAALRDQKAWQGLILLSPAVDCPRNFTLSVMSAIQGLLVRVIPRARLVPQPVIPNITLNAEERKLLAADEFFDPGKIRCQTGSMFLAAWNYIAKHEQELTLPILIHYSSIDKIVYPKATERFAERVGSQDITVKAFDRHAHDIYLDDSKVESCQLVISWILEHAKQGKEPLPAAIAPNESPAKL